MYTVFTSAYKMNLYDNCRIIFSIVKSRMMINDLTDKFRLDIAQIKKMHTFAFG